METIAIFEGELRTPLLAKIQATIRAEVDPEFGFVAPGAPAWTALDKPLGECCVALVTTGGLHRASDEPFRALHEPLGDTSYRVIPQATRDDELELAAPYVDQKYTPRDSEVALPRRALEQLADEGVIAAAAARHYSFVGGVVRPYPGLQRSAAELATALRQDGVDIVVLLPTCSLCVQTVTVVARELEAAGSATVCLSLLPELSEIGRAPRTLSVHFPFGAPAGDPGHGALHAAVLTEALQLVATARAAGLVVASRAQWRKGD